MHYKAKMFVAIVGGSAVVTLGAPSADIVEGQHGPRFGGGNTADDAATSIETTPPNARAVGEAAPAIKGPAPLPSAEHGLPG